MDATILKTESLDSEKLSQLDAYIAQVEDKTGDVIAILHHAQGLFGYLPAELQLYIARAIDLPAAKINGIVSFYSFFNEEPSGKYRVNICLGTACFVKGAAEVNVAFREQLEVDEKGNSKDGLFTVREVRCIGACGLAPVIMVNDQIYGHFGKDDVAGLIANYREKEGIHED